MRNSHQRLAAEGLAGRILHSIVVRSVDKGLLRPMPPRLLVSVRDAEEARIASAAGADIIDVKEPQKGSLGRAPISVLQQIAKSLPQNQPLSIALGEWYESVTVATLPASTRWAKVGWAHGLQATAVDWLHQVRNTRPAQLIGVVYADHVRVQAPPLETILSWMRLTPQQSSGILIDTAIKDGRGLLYWCSLGRLHQYQKQCHRYGLFLAVAGSLDHRSIVAIKRYVKPDIIAVRGAACVGQRRQARIQKIECNLL
jgi:uncharacterized protein (UPF0264 family)